MYGSQTKLVIVIPAYNEEEMLPITVDKIGVIMQSLIAAGKISDQSQMLVVNDGSTDHTWSIIKQLASKNPLVTGISFSKNFGHQNALMAGIETAQDADAIITIDADLQDDIGIIEKMVDKYHEGYEVVYGVRNNRDTDSWFKKNSALLFYKLMKLLGTNTIENHADYRLLGHKAIKSLLQYQERNLFLRGIVPQLGFKSTSIYYRRSERQAGETKYPLKKMVKFALDGITSFSTVPLKCISWVGFASVLVALVLSVVTLIQYLSGHTLPGWSSIMLSLWFIGGAQLISIGVIGEYIGKIFVEVKHRPLFEIEEDLYHK